MAFQMPANAGRSERAAEILAEWRKQIERNQRRTAATRHSYTAYLNHPVILANQRLMPVRRAP